jgi:hypothetical protein
MFGVWQKADGISCPEWLESVAVERQAADVFTASRDNLTNHLRDHSGHIYCEHKDKLA